MKKPITLLYGIEDRPPPGIRFTVGLQFVAVAMTNFAPLLALLKAAGVAPLLEVPYLQVTLLVLAAGTLLLSFRQPWGGGVFATSGLPYTYLPAALTALQAGGMHLVFGMTLFGGILQILLSFVLPRLRPFVPLEISGVIVVMIALQMALTGARFALDGNEGTPSSSEWVIGAITMAALIVFSIWSKGLPKLLAGLLGLIVGFIASALLGVFRPQDWASLEALPVISAPLPVQFGWSFDPGVAISFTVAAIGVTMATTGNLSSLQRLTDPEWVRPDFKAIACGVRTDGLTVALAGLLGSYPGAVSNSCMGLMSATGIASRCVAPIVALMLAILAFFPRVSGVFALLPGMVIGATLAFSACFVLVSGIEIIASRLLDSRRTLVIGASIMVYLNVLTHPLAFVTPSSSLNAALTSPFTMGALTALCLNGLFRLGIRREMRIALDPANIVHDAIQVFVQRCGAAWGARRDVMARVTYGIFQSAETLADTAEITGELWVRIAFDEFRVDVDFLYRGLPVVLATERPTADEVTEGDGHLRLAGYLLRQNADRVSMVTLNGMQRLRFMFEH